MSPLLFFTKQQACLLQQELGEGIIVEYAMRYGSPSIKDKVHSLQKQGAVNIKFSYPQYSATTTATVYDDYIGSITIA